MEDVKISMHFTHEIVNVKYMRRETTKKRQRDRENVYESMKQLKCMGHKLSHPPIADKVQSTELKFVHFACRENFDSKNARDQEGKRESES